MGRRTIRMIVVAMALTAIAAEGAAAQAPPTFGGGRLVKAGPVKGYTPSVNLSLQPRGANIAMLFDTTVLCGHDVIDVAGSGEVPWDGASFSFKGASVQNLRPGRLAHEYTVTGTLSGGRATGTLHVVGVRRRGGRSQRCGARPTRGFEVRFAGPPAGAPAKPQPRAFYAGTSSYEIFDRIQAPVALRVTKDSKQVAAQWTIAAKCGRGSSQFVNFSPPMRVRAGGRFARKERFSVQYNDALIRYRASFAGRFASDGATGTLRLRTRIFNRKGTKLQTRCDSGTRTWNAAPPPAAAGGGGAGAGAGGTAPMPSPAPSTLPANSAVSMTSDEGDYIGQGKSYADGVGGPIVAEGTRGQILTLGVLSGGEWRAAFAAPPGQELTEGVTYTGALQTQNDGTSPYLSVSGEGRGCGYSSGTFTVDHISWYPDGTLQAFSARFEQHCEGAVAALRGTWTYRHT
jgi:hypothetical protein